MSSVVNNIIDVAKQYVSWDPNAFTRQVVNSALEKNDLEALNKLLAKRLSFGTAGLRATMGAEFEYE